MQTYQNPFRLDNQWDQNQLGDPYIMRHDGYYYLYCSSHQAEIKCWRSENLVQWDYMGSVCNLPEIDGAYAPEVLYTHGKFYMVTSPKGSGHYLLVSDSPTGPFTLVSENFGLLIDGSLFADDDGKVYFTRAGHQGIVVHDTCLPNTPDTSGATIPQSYLNHWTEGSMIIKRDGFYFLTMTGNHLLSRGYRVDYIVSPHAPDKGYVTPRNPTLLLETGDEFHALGHSSTVLGPDMDSYYIAYHSFNFLAEPKYRSLNIDRLFFDGARMYVNAAWWQQGIPAGPVFKSRDGEGLARQKHYGKTYWVTPPTGVHFTAELTINPKGKAVDVLLNTEDLLHIHDGCVSFNGKKKQLPQNIDLNADLTIRIAQGKKSCKIWLNGMGIMEWATQEFTVSGKSGIYLWSEADTTPGFVGFSHTAEGTGDFNASKNIPGRFLAVHTGLAQPVEIETHIETGFQAQAICGSTQSFYYKINTKKAGNYTLFIRMQVYTPDARIIVNGETFTMQKLRTNGFVTVCAGAVDLPQGESMLKFSGLNGISLIDEFTLVESSQVPQSVTVVDKGRLTYDDLRIMGHKRANSMLRKQWGFTCAENHGMGFVGGDGWTDYTVKANLNINRHTRGTVSIYLRTTKESWFEHQASPALLGYRVIVNSEGIALMRCHYGEKPLAS
ncbi:MAG: family 43 glycosylhydrolase, partial [Defluviitaleaceae bacterium]|nr:family 43 glycosylhydrolase [Defluviitaleaceae bacterium]